MPGDGEDRPDSIAVGTMMAAAGGFLDAFTYVGHGHVFANAMTGNVVLLGVALAGRHFAQALRHLVPIVAFLAGVACGRSLFLPRVARAIRHPHLVCISVEIAFLFVVGWLPASFPDLVLTLAIAFVASIQLSTFSKIRGSAYASTFTTGNLRKFAESALAWTVDRSDGEAREQTVAFAAVCAAFFVGALAGGVATGRFGNPAAWIVDAWLALTTCVYLVRNRKTGSVSKPAPVEA